jgi:dihydrolipoamide dehydrogenase
MTIKVTILGAGPGGYIAAIRAAQLGAEVTVIEKENVGGTCLNWGCIPSKIMITTASLLEKMQNAQKFAINVESGCRVNMEQLMARKQAIIATQSKGILALFSHHKINYILGTAHITSSGLVKVQTAEGGELDVHHDKLILATGSRPFELPALPFDGDNILSSNHALSLTAVPESVLIVGGGVIGCEFASILSSLGAKVTVVEALDRLLPLPSVDENCTKVLQREMKKHKINLIVNRAVESYEKAGSSLKVTLGPSPFQKEVTEKEQQRTTIDVEKMIVCIGRTPNTDGLGLENIGLATDAKGWIEVDENMETSVPEVYAIGDVLGPAKIMLAHVASTEGQVAAENAMGGDQKMEYNVVPGAIFTTPEVANVGLSEAQAKELGIAVRADSVLFRTLGKAQVIGEIAGEAKIVSKKDTGEILGVHIVGPHATDLIAESALAMKMGGSVGDIASTIHAHPTLAEIMFEASCKALDRSLHG